MCPLSDFPFESHFLDVSGCRLHYIDAGDRDAPVILFLHGVPTWSYTFRKIIPRCLAAGYRVVAPDLPGFGLSQKDIPPEKVSLGWLTNIVGKFVDMCQISRPVLFAHDWGGVIGLMLASSRAVDFSGLILCNSLLPFPGIRKPLLFKAWRCFASCSPVLPVPMIVNLASRRRLSRTEKKGYGFPFTSGRDKKLIRIMPRLLPFKEEEAGYKEVEDAWLGLSAYNSAVLTLFSQGDPITRGGEKAIQERIPGARNQAHKLLKGGHFVQEDAPEEIAESILAFMKTNR